MPNDTGCPSDYAHKVNQLLGYDPHPEYKSKKGDSSQECNESTCLIFTSSLSFFYLLLRLLVVVKILFKKLMMYLLMTDGRPRIVSPSNPLWWSLLNTELRKKNCRSLTKSATRNLIL